MARTRSAAAAARGVAGGKRGPRSAGRSGPGHRGSGRPERGPYTFVLDRELVRRARREVAERDVVRSIEAALAAAIDYQTWVRGLREGQCDAWS